MKRTFITLALVILAACGIFWLFKGKSAPEYVTAPLSTGDISKTVITTGTLNPVTTVQVGTYVSGTIQSLFCDYNTKVKAGQLCAKIDPRPYQVVYDQANANLASAEAQLKKDQAILVYTQKSYDRDLKLVGKGIVSESTLENDKSALDQANAQIGIDLATIKERKAALDAAKVNLDYTDIISPVDGTVVSRSIDIGQTVAASFQTPTLFLIAKDLTQMQVDTNVSESDVGEVREGQKAFFTVEAFPDKKFEGKVVQVRQAPITVQNVVTYDVVVGVENPDFKLLPGMTANTRIITADRKDVLRAPVQALHFVPDIIKNAKNTTDANTSDSSTLYILSEGKPKAVTITTGLGDGVYTEISGADLKSGDLVIIGEKRTDKVNTANTPKKSPLKF